MADDLPDAPWATSDLPDAPWAAPKKESSALDFFKSIPRGILGGLTNAASASGQTAQIEMGQPVDVPSGRDARDIVEKEVTGSLHRPQTTAGQFGETAGEFLGSPASYVAPGGLLSKAALAAASGLGSELGGQLTAGTRAEPFGRLGGALLAGGRGRTAPSESKLADAVNADLAARFGPGAIKPGSAAAEFGVPLTTGEAAGDLSKIQFEQAARKGAYGSRAQQEAQSFFDARESAVQDALKQYGRNLDPAGQQIAQGPVASAELAGDSLSQAARIQKEAYRAHYDEFSNLPGVIHASAFEGVAQRIKEKLSLGDEPVIIDDVTTPIASKAVRDIENNIDRLKVQNRTDPYGQPGQETIVGINLKGVDQTRKRLMQFASDARANPSDSRAVRAVIRAFDDNVEEAVSNGLFSGSDRALEALKDARAGFASYQKVFKPQKNDGGVGSVIDKIVHRDGDAGATANEVANWLYGAAGTGASGLSSRVAQRVQSILGPESPEWSAVRQGMFERLTQSVEGKDAFGAQKMSQRIQEFLNGSGRSTADVMFSPVERAQMVRLARALKETVPPPGAVNYSNTAYVGSSIARNTLDALSHFVKIPGLGWVVRVGQDALGNRASAAKTRSSLYGQPEVPGRIYPMSPVGPAIASQPVSSAANIGAAPTQQQAEVGPFAHGGTVPHGARLAPDGHHYVHDPRRPGKYLRVVFRDQRRAS